MATSTLQVFSLRRPSLFPIPLASSHRGHGIGATVWRPRIQIVVNDFFEEFTAMQGTVEDSLQRGLRLPEGQVLAVARFLAAP